VSSVPGSARSLQELDRASLLHPFTSIAEHLESGPRIISRGRGARVVDTDGREYLDGMAGLWCVNVGYGRREIAEAIAGQAERLAFYHSFASSANEPAIRLADRLLSIAPSGMSKVFFGSSGSEANDTQIKLVWYYNNLRGKPAKKKIVARRRGYHGVTLGAASLTGLPAVHAAFDLPLPGFVHVSAPHYYWGAAEGASEREFAEALAHELDAVIRAEDPETVAAFIAEPVMGAGGVIVPPESYFAEIQAVLARHDVLLIADEVICGFGRLGTMFGSQRYDLRPDLMTLAKGLTSGYVPMSACLISERVWEVLRDASPEVGPFAHGFTYSGHPVAAAAGLANLDIIEHEKLVENASEVGGRLQRALRETCGAHPLVGEIRGVGLIAGVELVADRRRKVPFEAKARAGQRLAAILADEGLLCRPLGNSVALSPPLVVTAGDVDEICACLARGLDRLAAALRAEGDWKPAGGRAG
jgi:L-2,4-diaminobutyrate transaminase